MSGDGYYRINVQGVIQGVGFRPFVFLLARDLGLAGTVSNSSSGVNIRLRAAKHELDTFLDRLESGAPEPAVIESIGVFDARPFEADDFEIVASSREGERSVLISPDLATCADCFKELLDESDRRFRYPFINCTNCGPRFTIIADTPYDRPCTSMAEFEMCEECQREYDDPSDRRFHAQPNACPRCGPRLWLADRNGDPVDGDPIAVAADLLRDGRILALKGLGGFHLACDATSDEAVACLRERKMRYAKPLAVMVKDLEEAARYCEVSEKERQILQSPRCPIVLLEEKEGSPISGRVAPNLTHQGLLLPYTPVHHLLVRETGLPLVMTSGNISSEPISVDNREALLKLSGIADYFLLHDRDILVRYDDSVVRVMDESESPIRRARGYSPYPVRVRPAAVEVLGVGAEYKNTFCLLRGEHAFIGQHIGDLETREEMRHYEQALAAMKRLFSLQPQLVAYDLHPEYMSTQMAMDMPLEKVGIQHHHAHVASCMADNSLDERVIGVAWDGTGYGADGTVWGGEFLLCDMGDYQRVAHLYQHPMPGGDACIHDIYRMAAGALFGIFEDAG